MPRLKHLPLALLIIIIAPLIAIGGCVTSKSTAPESALRETAITTEPAPEITIYNDGKKFKPSSKLARELEVKLRALLDNKYEQTIGTGIGTRPEDFEKGGLAIGYKGAIRGEKAVFVYLEPATNTIYFDGVQYYTPGGTANTDGNNEDGKIALPAKYDRDLADIERAIITSRDTGLLGLWRSASENNELRLKLFIPSVDYEPLVYRAHISLENTSAKPIRIALPATAGSLKSLFKVALKNPDGSVSAAVQYGDVISSNGGKIDLSKGELVLDPQGAVFSHAVFVVEEQHSRPRDSRYPFHNIYAAWLPAGPIYLGDKQSKIGPIDIDMQLQAVQQNNAGLYYKPINPDDVRWITMQGGLEGFATKVLFKEKAPGKIRKIITMLNKSTKSRPSVPEEIWAGVRGYPIGMLIQLKNGQTRSVYPHGNRLLVIGQKDNRYVTAYSNDVVAYLNEGWKKDMPEAQRAVFNKASYRPGDTVTISGDGCTASEVEIIIEDRTDTSGEKQYVIGRVPSVSGEWKWKGTVQRNVTALDGKRVNLYKDHYVFVLRAGDRYFGEARPIITK